MSNEVKYISYEETLNVYNKMIDASEGGFDGVRDEGGNPCHSRLCTK